MLQRALHLAVVGADRAELGIADVEPPHHELVPWQPPHQETDTRNSTAPHKSTSLAYPAQARRRKVRTCRTPPRRSIRDSAAPFVRPGTRPGFQLYEPTAREGHWVMSDRCLDHRHRCPRPDVQPPTDEVRAQRRRILADPTLQSSPARRDMLRFVVEETLAGRADRLEGVAIALAVLGRQDDFDPQSDPVVRVEARRPRRDLDGYHVAAGRRGPVVISIPKGGHVPHFDWREDTAPAMPAPAERPALDDEAAGPTAAGGAHRGGRAIAVLVAAAILVVAGSAWLWLRAPDGTTAGRTGELARGPAVMVLPFEALSASEDDRFLAAGITQELITNLMRFPDTNVLALKALSSINHYTGNYEEGERLARAALALNPNDPDTLAQLGWRLAVRGRFDEGIPYLERAIARTVSPPGWYFHLIAIDLYLRGDHEAMLTAAERSAVDGSAISQSLIAIAQGALGNREAARHALDRMAEISPPLGRDPADVYRRRHAIGRRPTAGRGGRSGQSQRWLRLG